MEKLLSSSSVPHRAATKVQFSILGPEEILKQSVTVPDGIVYPEAMEGGKPKIGGVMDPRQGTIDKVGRCKTCNGKMHDCPGHFGHINLAKPVFYGHYIPHIMSVLKCICFSCSKLLIDLTDEHAKEMLRKTRNDMKKRRIQMVEVCRKIRICEGPSTNEGNEDTTEEPNVQRRTGCGRKTPHTISRAGLTLTAKWKEAFDDTGTTSIKLTAEKVLEIFKGMDDDSIVALGFHTKFSRPEWMIATVLPVLPLCVRPSVLSFGTTRSQDDLTHKLADIVKANKLLKDNEQNGVATHILNDNLELLEYHVNTMFDNNMPGVARATQKSGRALKSIKQRLAGKEGRVRGNLMGKRVDFCARTVITPDPILKLDEVGVPRHIAQILTYPEIVTPFNIDMLSELVANGPNHYPGAVYIIRKNGERINLRLHPDPSNLHLEYGYKVERHLRDGDPVIFNRQPTLHKMSMMCHRVKVMSGSTFRLNLSVTKPYNADFDGDEMNLHLPQSLEAKAEVVQLASVARMIVTPQSNKPVMGIVQDTLTGVYKMSHRNEFLTKEEMMNLLMHFPDWNGRLSQPAILKPVPLWTGKQLFSVLIPGKVNCLKDMDKDDKDGKRDRWMTPNDTTVLVENGELLSGILCKKTLGASEGSLMHVVYLEEGYEKAAQFYSNIQLVVNQWLLIGGHSVGVSDMVAEAMIYNDVRDLIAKAKETIANITEDLHCGKMTKLTGCTLRQTYENKVNFLLNDARDKAGKLVQENLSKSNQFKIMVAAGSKGDSNNISQIIACVGQQNVEGKRIPFGYANRTAPHFVIFDHGPESRGFVENSYLAGLNSSEFFFHAMAGREGIIDTAIKTSETGYIQRRLIKAMESIMVNYDGTVRNQVGQLIQVTYGEDGLAGEWVESQKLLPLELNTKGFEKTYKFSLDDRKLKNVLRKNIIDDLNSDVRAYQAFKNEYEQLLNDRLELMRIFPSGCDRLVLPCNLQRMIWNAHKIFKLDNNHSNLNPVRVIEDVRQLCHKLKIVKGDDHLSVSANNDATLMMSIMLRSTLSSKRVAEEFHLSSEAFEWLIGEIETRFTQAQVHPGEMVGVLAAQSLGEPATQMTLNTFHHAGISSKNITLGVPRLKEIINVSKNPKCPSLTIFLDRETAANVKNADEVRNSLSYTVLKHVLESSQVLYEPDPSTTTIEEDRDLVETCFSLNAINQEKLSPFVLRFKLDPQKLYGCGKDMKASLIEEKIRGTYGADLDVSSFDETNVVRMRLKQANDNNDNNDNNDEQKEEENIEKIPDEDFLRRLDHQMTNGLALKGHPDIKSIHLCQSSTTTRQIKVIDTNGQYKLTKDWYLETEGSALKYVLSVDHIDHTSTSSNSVEETFQVLGIEATKKTIEKEMNTVLSFDGSYVNYRHLALLCDLMTNKGYLMAITRHGINRQDTGPIARASFEETMDIFVEAAVNAELDPLKGVSECVMVGKLAKVGTGCFEVYLDAKMCDQALEDVKGLLNDGLRGPIGDILGGATTPCYNSTTPLWQASRSPIAGGFSPTDCRSSPGFSPGFSPSYSPGYSPAYSPAWSPGSTSPEYGSSSPNYAPNTPSYVPASPAYQSSPGFTPTSPGFTAATPGYSPTSPGYSPTSPGFSPRSPAYSPGSPGYSPTSPSYSVSSPGFALKQSSENTNAGRSYSPSSPVYSPTSPGYSPTSPAYSLKTTGYSPASPSYTPASPNYTPGYSHPSPALSPNYSPSSPAYTPGFASVSPAYSPSSPAYSPSAAGYTPSYTPSSPSYSPGSPSFVPSSPNYAGSPLYSPTSPSYAPGSPAISPTSPSENDD